MHITGLLCEVGMVTVALVSALSYAKHPALQTEGNAGTLHRTILLALFSCLFSAVTCWLSVSGFGKLLSTLCRLSHTHTRPVRASISATSKAGAWLLSSSPPGRVHASVCMHGGADAANACQGHPSAGIGLPGAPAEAVLSPSLPAPTRTLVQSELGVLVHAPAGENEDPAAGPVHGVLRASVPADDTSGGQAGAVTASDSLLDALCLEDAQHVAELGGCSLLTNLQACMAGGDEASSGPPQSF